MNHSGPNEESHIFSDNDGEHFEQFYDKKTAEPEINHNFEGLQYLSTTYLSRNPPIMENDEETQNTIIEETQVEDETNENDAYFDEDNLSSIDMNDSHSTSLMSVSLGDAVNKTDLNKLNNKNEQLKMIYLRSFMDKIDKDFKEKDLNTQDLHREIVGCKQRMTGLEERRNNLYYNLAEAQTKDNITVVKRLEAEHQTVCQEIELETHVLGKLKEAYENADYVRNKALLEKTKYVMADHELKQREEQVAKQKYAKAQMRLYNEEKKLELFKSKMKRARVEEESRINQELQRQKETIEKAKISRQKANKFLNNTLRELKGQKDVEENSYQEHFEVKRKDLMGLKETIDHNKEIFQAKVNKNKFNAVKMKQQLIVEKNKILERGENPNFFIPRQKKMDEAERARRKFEEQQFENTQKIVKKILGEKENLEKKKRLYPNLFNINLKPINQQISTATENEEKQKTDLRMLGKIATTLGYSDDNLNLNDLIQNDQDQEEDDHYERRSMMDSTTIASKDDDDDSDLDELLDQEDCLVKPEFDGLWNTQVKKYDADDFYKKQVKFPTCFKTKTEQDLYVKTLDKLKKSAVREQVVAGRKFTGVSFRSNPKIIHFKDFVVGQTYTMKIVLTNISYSINTCKYLDISDRLKDFITIDFHPPGQLSAGLTCEFNVTFEPKINKDLEGELQFLASNGPFNVPISCTIKKCDLSVSTSSIYFGTIVIGEEANRKVQLINKGALGTTFKIMNEADVASKSNLDSSGNDSANVSCEPVKEEKTEGIRLGNVKEGYISPFETIDLDFFFHTSFPGKFQENFVIEFEDADSKDLNVMSKATAIDVPIWIENLNIDLKICMYDRLYQDVIRVHNRASAALRITFEVPSELKNHLEILPKTAFIQAKSEFAAQLKFIARQTLAKDAPTYFDEQTGVLELPLHIKVADQNKTVDYNLNAIVTTSDLEFDVKEIDFGYCTIYETAQATIKLTNHSILCQPFGFIKLPEHVNVQPNDGFGTLLPNETISIDINFCPKSAKEYKFNVLCKSLVNREFVISCKGVGVHPPLKLSAQRVNFKATSLNSTSFQTFLVENNHLDMDQHRHPVPRIGTGEIAKVGPTYFEFDLPKNCPFKLSPAVGQVGPGQKQKITLQYTAKLDENTIKQKALKIMKKRLADSASTKNVEATPMPALTESVEIAEGTNKNSKKKVPPAKGGKGTAASERPSNASSMSMSRAEARSPDIHTIEFGGPDYVAGLNNAIENYEGGLEHFQIACYVSTVNENNDPSQPIPYSIHNTLYLDVVCPSIKPEIITLTNPATRTVDFGKVSIGHKCIQKIAIKNVSKQIVNLKSSLFDTDGPFVLLNTLKPIKPGCIYNLIIGFIPNKSSIYHENFEIRTDNSNLNFTFNAVGVEPSFSLNFDSHILDFGYILAGEKAEKSIEMKNNSHIPIDFKITLDSSSKKLRSEAEKKMLMYASDPKFKPTIGPNNHAGQCSFDIFPLQGSIQAGSKLDFKVQFSPDHTSELFADVMRISLLSTDKNSRVIQLYGKCRKSNMYMRGVEKLTSNLNSESVLLTDIDASSLNDENKDGIAQKAPDTTDNSAVPMPIPVLLSLYSIASSKTVGEYSLAEKIIHIGAMKSAPTKEGKKTGDFTFENLKDINAKGFNIDLTKSAIEFGGERQVKVTWKPPPGVDVKQTMQASILLTTKANVQETWRLILQGRIVSESFHVT